MIDVRFANKPSRREKAITDFVIEGGYVRLGQSKKSSDTLVKSVTRNHFNQPRNNERASLITRVVTALKEGLSNLVRNIINKVSNFWHQHIQTGTPLTVDSPLEEPMDPVNQEMAKIFREASFTLDKALEENEEFEKRSEKEIERASEKAFKKEFENRD